MNEITYPPGKKAYCPVDIDNLYPWDKLSVMKLSIWLKEQYGRGKMLSAAIGVPQSFVAKMAKGEKQVPVERCVSIERATNGAVTRSDLRPDDWQDIWPELAAPQPTTEPAQAAA